MFEGIDCKPSVPTSNFEYPSKNLGKLLVMSLHPKIYCNRQYVTVKIFATLPLPDPSLPARSCRGYFLSPSSKGQACPCDLLWPMKDEQQRAHAHFRTEALRALWRDHHGSFQSFILGPGMKLTKYINVRYKLLLRFGDCYCGIIYQNLTNSYTLY